MEKSERHTPAPAEENPPDFGLKTDWSTKRNSASWIKKTGLKRLELLKTIAIVLNRRLSPIKMPDIVMEVTLLKLKGFKAELRGIAT